MEILFWGCFVGGALFAFISAILGDLLGSWLEGIFDAISADFLKPVVTASAITTFGGAGVLLIRYTSLNDTAVMILAILIALLISVIIYFAYVKPMENSENSIGYSHAELPGKLGEVTVPIPSKGYGEIMVKFVAGNTLHTAASWDRRDIPAGALVVIVDLKDGVVQVSELYETEQQKEMM
ncbi:NfeD-like partner-binding protein [Fontibacillus phaseoli]|uniref:NfeD-like partner-binding protein n=1 Tax=Fontibacillus phaseoli TaxID=1416533 RepID=A0A369BN35_9BACL|nr:protease [Fontibacillus phaseoli]RCX22495.1 NfeD-like partner-binding protein [Fontibacillus phaseoli]